MKKGSKKAKRLKIIKTTDLLPQSREFLLEKKLKKEKKKKIKELNLALENEKRKKERLVKIAEEDAHKRFLMWTGVACFMVLIFVFWIFNLKKVFSQTSENGNKENININNFADDFKKTFGEIKENFSEIKEDLKATSTESSIKEEEIVELKNRLEAMEDKIGTSTGEIATSSEENE